MVPLLKGPFSPSTPYNASLTPYWSNTRTNAKAVQNGTARYHRTRRFGLLRNTSTFARAGVPKKNHERDRDRHDDSEYLHAE
jgi:hypothetical protein